MLRLKLYVETGMKLNKRTIVRMSIVFEELAASARRAARGSIGPRQSLPCLNVMVAIVLQATPDSLTHPYFSSPLTFMRPYLQAMKNVQLNIDSITS